MSETKTYEMKQESGEEKSSGGGASTAPEGHPWWSKGFMAVRWAMPNENWLHVFRGTQYDRDVLCKHPDLDYRAKVEALWEANRPLKDGVEVRDDDGKVWRLEGMRLVRDASLFILKEHDLLGGTGAGWAWSSCTISDPAQCERVRAHLRGVFGFKEKPKPKPLTDEELRVAYIESPRLRAVVEAHEKRQAEIAEWERREAVPKERPKTFEWRSPDGDRGMIKTSICASNALALSAGSVWVQISSDQWQQLKAACDAMFAWMGAQAEGCQRGEGDDRPL